MLLMAVPLAWRRRAPILVTIPIALGFALQGVPDAPPESLATLVAVLVAAYTAAAVHDRRAAAAGVTVLLAGGLIESALVGDGDYGFITVVIAVAAAAGLAMGTRSRQAELDREREAARAVAAERERIARELHDSVAHAVSLMVVQAGAAQTAVGADPEAARALDRIRTTGNEAVADLGRMVGLLRNEVAPVYSIAQPERLIDPFRAAGMELDVAVTGTPRTLPRGLDGAAFRIAQEALTNALKHGAGSARVAIGYESTSLRVVITNPVAASNAHDGTGHGIAGMRERAQLYGGHVSAGPAAGGMFEVDARIPFEQ
jgi:signal transduction histidine kinase